MAVRLTRWIPALATLAIGGALGWIVEPALTPDGTAGASRNDHGDLPSADEIGGAWLPLAELERHVQSLSDEGSHALLLKLDPEFWCAHPNGRDALRTIVHRLAKERPAVELTRELLRHFRLWDLPAGVRAEMLRNLAGALAAVPE